MFQRFLNLSRVHKRLISVFADVAVLFFALWAAFSLRLDQQFWVPDRGQLIVSGLTVAITIAVFVKLGLYRAVIRYLSDRAFITVITGVFVSAITLILLGYWLEVLVPRSVPIIYGALAFIFVSGTRMTVRMLVNRPKHRNKQFVGIVGAGETGLQLANALDQGTEYHPCAFITLMKSNHRALVNGIPVYDISHIERVVREHRIKRLLLALDADSGIDRKRLLKRLEPLAIPVQTVPTMSELVAGQARINDIRDLEIEDLLGRDPVQPDNAQVAASLYNRSVLVTGAGGSIGSELCRQIIRHRPTRLVLFEQSEFSLYAIERELQALNRIEGLGVEIHPLLGSVTHRRRCEAVMRSFGIETVYHAAAYKHVPLVEHNIIEGVQNNVFGTFHVAEAAIATGCSAFCPHFYR